MPMRFRRRAVVLVPLTALFLAGCDTLAGTEVPVSTVNLVRADGSVAGTVRAFDQPNGVLLRIQATGLPPGSHGVHVHMTGRCDAPGFTSAGGHWNPTTRKHGHNNPGGWHSGDLGNVAVAPDGKITAGLLVPAANLYTAREAAPNVLLDADGASLVIHAKADDEMTDPSGNSGDRIACAVLR
jgi:Cu-Zn family superoxide dismutase